MRTQLQPNVFLLTIVDDGFTRAALPQSSAFLRRYNTTHLIDATCHGASRLRRSVLDFLVGEFFPRLRGALRRFEQGAGPPMTELLTAQQRQEVDAELLRKLQAIELVPDELAEHAEWWMMKDALESFVSG